MPGMEGSTVEEQRTGLRQIVPRRILGVDAHLDGVTALRERLLRPRQRLAGGDENLRAHEIDARHLLGDRVLDLQPCVHLEVIERRIVSGPLEKEFDRPRVAIPGRPRDRHRRIAHAAPQRRCHRRRRRLLDDLLVASLDRAFALEEVHDVTVMVGDDLELDVTRPLDETLDIQRAVAECGLRLAARLRNGSEAAPLRHAPPSCRCRRHPRPV